MTQDRAAPRWRNAWVISGAVVFTLALAVYLIDADPAFLFENAVASLVIAALGVGLIYVGWQRTSAEHAD